MVDYDISHRLGIRWLGNTAVNPPGKSKKGKIDEKKVTTTASNGHSLQDWGTIHRLVSSTLQLQGVVRHERNTTLLLLYPYDTLLLGAHGARMT